MVPVESITPKCQVHGCIENLKTTQNDQTIILRFKTSSDGLLFGAGTDALTTTGKNMTVSIRDGKLRLVMRNTKKQMVHLPAA